MRRSPVTARCARRSTWPILTARSIRTPTPRPLTALDVGARVFGHVTATEVGAHCDDAALVLDVAVYHLTGSAADIPAALEAFRRAAGPLLERTRTV